MNPSVQVCVVYNRLNVRMFSLIKYCHDGSSRWAVVGCSVVVGSIVFVGVVGVAGGVVVVG